MDVIVLQEEMTIRAMSTNGRRRRKNNNKGNDASFFAPAQSVRTIAPAPPPEKCLPGNSDRPCEGSSSVAARKGKGGGRTESASGTDLRFHPDAEVEGERRRSSADSSCNVKRAAPAVAAGTPESQPPSCPKSQVEADTRSAKTTSTQRTASERAIGGEDGERSEDAGSGILARPGSCAVGSRDSRRSTGSRGLESLDGNR